MFVSSCPQSDERNLTDRNMELVYVDLINRFKTEKVKNAPIRFTTYDVCGRSNAYQFGVRTTETLMYLRGEEVDRLRGGPSGLDVIEDWKIFLKNKWVPTNLTDTNGELAWRFEGTAQEREVAVKP